MNPDEPLLSLDEMLSAQRIHDIGMPIYNGMWCYRSGWENSISPIAETALGDNSTVYRFNLCSHTGTYLETSQHKLSNDLLLSNFATESYLRSCKLVVVEGEASKEISRSQFELSVEAMGGSIESEDALIVATGWGMNHRDSSYLSQCPYFSEELVAWLCEKKLDLLGVDTPIIDNPQTPFGAIGKLFERNPRLLVLAPLVIDTAKVSAGRYFLSAAPLQIEGVSASLCRPMLISEDCAVNGQRSE